jgi:cobalt-zinc-cadmium resistance protein CzcA
MLVLLLKRLYEPLLKAAVRKPTRFVLGALALVTIALGLYVQLGQEFMPTLDEKNVAMQVTRPPSTALSQSQDMQLKVEQRLAAFPEVAHVFSKTGTAEAATDPMPPSASDTFIMLKPQELWPDPALTKQALIARMESATDELLGNAYQFTQPIQMRFNELLAGSRGDLAIKVFGDQFETILPIANQIAGNLRNIRGAEDVKVEQVAGQPFLEIKVDKAEIARLGLSIATVQDVIGAAIGGREAGFLFEGDRRFPIVVRLPEVVRSEIDVVKNLPVPLGPTQGGRTSSVLLKQVAQFVLSEGSNQISRENGKRYIGVTANVRGRDIASVVEEAQSRLRSEVKIPAGSWITWGGQFENLATARQRLIVIVPGAFFVIFLLLYSALGSPRDALLVFSAVPLALVGGVAALWLRGMPFSVSAAVGFIALSGVAVLNSLVMLTFIKELMDEGRTKTDAIMEGAIMRLRPIAMTALVASLGFVPMALASGTGAEVQKPLATVVIGGLVSATLLTLLVLPALYARFGAAANGGKQAAAAPRSPLQFREAAE